MGNEGPPRISRAENDLPSEPWALSAAGSGEPQFPESPLALREAGDQNAETGRGACPATPLPYLGQENAQEERSSRLHFARLDAPGGVFIHALGCTEHIFRGSQALRRGSASPASQLPK